MSIKYIHTPDAHACLQQTFIETVIQGWSEHKSLHSEQHIMKRGIHTQSHTHRVRVDALYTHECGHKTHTHVHAKGVQESEYNMKQSFIQAFSEQK